MFHLIFGVILSHFKLFGTSYYHTPFSISITKDPDNRWVNILFMRKIQVLAVERASFMVHGKPHEFLQLRVNKFLLKPKSSTDSDVELCTLENLPVAFKGKVVTEADYKLTHSAFLAVDITNLPYGWNLTLVNGALAGFLPQSKFFDTFKLESLLIGEATISGDFDGQVIETKVHDGSATGKASYWFGVWITFVEVSQLSLGAFSILILNSLFINSRRIGTPYPTPSRSPPSPPLTQPVKSSTESSKSKLKTRKLTLRWTELTLTAGASDAENSGILYQFVLVLVFTVKRWSVRTTIVIKRSRLPRPTNLGRKPSKVPTPATSARGRSRGRRLRKGSSRLSRIGLLVPWLRRELRRLMVLVLPAVLALPTANLKFEKFAFFLILLFRCINMAFSVVFYIIANSIDNKQYFATAAGYG